MDKCIEMCRQATEIQEAWEPKVGDPITGETTYSGQLLDGAMMNMGKPRGWLKHDITWLPRIEDLMKMLSYIGRPDGSGSGRGDGSILRDCLAYAEENRQIMADHRIVDASGLFLCFAMSELYNKSWNGTDWEKI